MSIASRFYMRIHDGSQKKDTRKECLKLDYGNLLRGGRFVQHVPCIPRDAYCSALRKIPPLAVCEPRHLASFPSFCFAAARFVFTTGRKEKSTSDEVLFLW